MTVLKKELKKELKQNLIYSMFLSMMLFMLLPGTVQADHNKPTEHVVAGDVVPADYCYKPDKPLMFSTARYKKRYEEDVAEYERCRMLYTEMYERIKKIQSISEEAASFESNSVELK